ncbi:MAG: hypothetical protein HYW78_03605 [Parcubacteria group bacterium]|nr:hypothetical protein [Parcubacteria group bacterium]
MKKLLSLLSKKTYFFISAVFVVIIGTSILASFDTVYAVLVRNLEGTPSLSSDAVSRGFTDSKFDFWKGSSPLYTTSSVGINTTTPQSKLHLKGGGVSLGSILQQGVWNNRVPLPNTLTTVVSGSGGTSKGTESDLTIGADGNPVISYAYYNGLNYSLRIVKCGDLLCSTNNTESILDTAGDTGLYTSIAIGTDRFPVIAYYDLTNRNLKVYKCSNETCSTGAAYTVDGSASDVGKLPSIAIGTDGLPIISYWNATAADLNVAQCGDINCDGTPAATITVVDSAVQVGAYSAIAIGTNGFPVISYEDASNDDLKFVQCTSKSCSTFNAPVVVDDVVGVGYTAITISTDTTPLISYIEGENSGNYKLRVAKCGNPGCTSGNTVSVVDGGGTPGRLSSILIGVDGLPLISYYEDGGLDVRFAKCGNAACSANNVTTTLDSSGSVGEYTSLAIGADGLPIISYYDSTNAALKVAHCGNTRCIPYWTYR